MSEVCSSSSLLKEWRLKIIECQNFDSLEDIRVLLLGKSGLITAELKSLGQLEPEQRRIKGAEINAVKDKLTALLSEQKQLLQANALEQRLKAEALDVTLPIRPEKKGKVHLLTQVIQDIKEFFRDRGFEVVEGPEVEDEHHNFDALNIPAHHPARQSHDTFYIKNHPSRLLRTHTSTVQIRTLAKTKPPVRIITIGRVYRSDALDATHAPMFHQLEGLVLEPGTHMGHLKGCLIDFCRHFFGIEDVPARLRPSFFPFTEPSAELDVRCSRANGQLKIGQGDSWLEILGGGMVHPQVLENCGIDPTQVQGFAFGVGIERLVMLKYGISDIRYLYESDERWLNHYGSSL